MACRAACELAKHMRRFVQHTAAPVKGAAGRLDASIITYGNVISSEGPTTTP